MFNFKKIDLPILILMILILTISLPILYSVAPEMFSRQLIWLAISLIAFLLLNFLDYRSLENFPFIFYLLSVFLLIITFLFGEVTRGSVRWLSFGSLNLQSSEISKPLLILTFASLATKLDLREIKNILILFILVSFVSLLIFLQPDLGSTLVVVFVFLSIIFMAGLKLRYFFFNFLLASASLPLIWHFLKDYQRQRIAVFLSPFSDPLGQGYHLLQSMITVGAGQFWGRGLGRGTQSHLLFLPEYHTDFIYASLSEELGFLGSILLLFFFFLLFSRILHLANNCQDRFGFLICIGVASLLFFQVLINVGMNLGLLPITGVPLPLVSYGGSSLLTTLISLGLVSSVANFGQNEEHLEIH